MISFDMDGYRWKMIRLWPFHQWVIFHFYTVSESQMREVFRNRHDKRS